MGLMIYPMSYMDEKIINDLHRYSAPLGIFPKRPFELIGFLTDGFGTTNGQILVSHAHFILPDGKLKPLPWI